MDRLSSIVRYRRRGAETSPSALGPRPSHQLNGRFRISSTRKRTDRSWASDMGADRSFACRATNFRSWPKAELPRCPLGGRYEVLGGPFSKSESIC